MIELWFALLLIPPFLWALSNFYDKLLVERVTTSMSAFMFYSNQLIPVFVLGIFFYRPIVEIEWYFILAILIQGIIFMYSFMLYGKALQTDEGTHVGSLFGLITLFLILFEYLFLGILLTLQDYIGVVGIIFAALLLATPHLSLKLFKPRKSLYYMSVLTLLLALHFILSIYYFERYDFWSVMFYLLIGSYLGVISLLFNKQNRVDIHSSFKYILTNPYYILLIIFANIVTEVSDLLYHYVISIAPSVTIVSAIANIQFIYTYILGILLTLIIPKFVKEDISKYQLLRKGVAIIILIGGILLIQL